MLVRAGLESSVDIEQCLQSRQTTEMTSRLYGREPLRVLQLPNGESLLVRIYRHGGLLRAVTGRLFITWPPRPFRELSITEEARRRGIPTIEVWGACVERVWGPVYRGCLLTRQLSGANDLWSVLNSELLRSLGPNQVFRAVATSVRMLHQRGIYHRDLNLKNILVRPEPEAVKSYLIDFDKARLFSMSLPAKMAQRNLDRLLRSARKLDPLRKYLSEEHWSWFLACYHGSDGHEV